MNISLSADKDNDPKNQIDHIRMLAFFVDFEENQLLDGEGCN